MRSYIVDFFKLSKDLLPHFLQQQGALGWVSPNDLFWINPSGESWGTGAASKHLAWLRVLVSQVSRMNEVFRSFVSATRYEMYITGQVVYLEQYLNDLYDPVARRIYIGDGDASIPIYLNNKPINETLNVYNKAEGQPAPVLLNRSELANQNDFVIVIPYQNIPFVIREEMRARVIKYKQAGKRFAIRTTLNGPLWPVDG